MEETRIDRWLWAVRFYKTRSLATAACSGGHVRVNGSNVKPAAKVKVGDQVEVTLEHRHRIVEVANVIEKRVGASAAADCLVDHSPPEPPREERAAVAFARDRGSGRPTKRDRRALDRFREG